MIFFGLFIVMLYTSSTCEGRKHHLYLTNDIRRYFSVSTFGFFKHGMLTVNLESLAFSPPLSSSQIKFGFSLTRTVSDSVTPYLESHQDTCLLLDDDLGNDENVDIMTFILDLKSGFVEVNCSKNFDVIVGYPPNNATKSEDDRRNRRSIARKRSVASITSDTYLLVRKQRESHPVAPESPGKPHPENIPAPPPKNEKSSTEMLSDQDFKAAAKQIEEVIIEEANKDGSQKATKESSVAKNATNGNGETLASKDLPVDLNTCTSIRIPYLYNKKERSYSFQFYIIVTKSRHEGLYSLYFHNCANYGITQPINVNLSISLLEQNQDTYLSAGEIPLPQLYFFMSMTFFGTGIVWFMFLRRKKKEAFKIHYLMGSLVFVKSLSLLFHGINYYYISRDGFQIQAWAVLYYITHLLKGALLFITIVLIGTGWAFIKHILSDKDKKIFMIVIPLQVLANVAEIIMEESEEGETQHTTWREIFILVDLLCCGAILLPVVWSVDFSA